MPEKTDPASRRQIAVGAIVVTVGLILLLNQVTDLRFTDIGHLWPLIVIAIGASRLFGSREPEEQRLGYTLIFLGGWFLINTFGLFGLDWGISWPLALVAVGLARLFAGGGLQASGAFLVLLGLVLQAIVLGLFGLDWDQAWPLLIVAAGLWIILRAFGRGRRPPNAKEPTE